MTIGPDSRSIGQRQQQHHRQEFAAAVRALLMVPLMNPAHADFAAVRRHLARWLDSPVMLERELMTLMWAGSRGYRMEPKFPDILTDDER